MRITLFILAIVVAVIAILFSPQSSHPIASIGYFLLSGAMFIGAAVWRSGAFSNQNYRSIQKVYGILAEGDVEMDTLLKRLLGKNTDMGTSEYYQVIIGLMLSKRMIVIKNGRVAIGEGSEQSV